MIKGEKAAESFCREEWTANEERSPRVKRVDRRQLLWRTVDVERLISEDHEARLIWEVVGQIDTRSFYRDIRAVEGVAGREPFDPKVLLTLWLYAISRGIHSSRQIAERCGYEPAFQWITGMEEINHHTISDFRTAHREALDELFSQVLGVMTHEGLITLATVAHDGTKVLASAGRNSFKTEKTLREHISEAQAYISDLASSGEEEMSPRRRAARERGLRERLDRCERAKEQLETLRKPSSAGETEHGESAGECPRLSATDPDARKMRQPDGGIAPGYNVQISTDAAHGAIVGVRVSQAGTDYEELKESMSLIQETMGSGPSQVLADGGYCSRGNIIEMEGRNVDFIAPIKSLEEETTRGCRQYGVTEEFLPDRFAYDPASDRMTCPAGKPLVYSTKKTDTGLEKFIYTAAWNDCAACPHRKHCCPRSLPGNGRRVSRIVEHPAVERHRAKMETELAQHAAKRRGPVAEFSNLWIKEKHGLRRFHLRGRLKVYLESLWACLTYNIQLLIRLTKRKKQETYAFGA